MSSQRSTSSLPPASVSRREHSTRRLRGNRSIVDGPTNDVSPFALRPSPFALRPSPFALRPSHCGLSAATIAQLEIEVARVDENSESLAQDENRVADIKG